MLTEYVWLVHAADTKAGATTFVMGPNVADPGTLTRKQAFIWVPIVFFIIIISTVIFIYQIDDVKKRDTILYAKFIANLKDKQNWVAE